jgi:hypothetical protein
MSERVIMMKSHLSSQYMSTLAMGIKLSPVMRLSRKPGYTVILYKLEEA